MTKYEVELTDEQARWLITAYPHDTLHVGGSGILSALAGAVRANPPKPPRMAEPTEYGARVIAARGGPWKFDHRRRRYIRWTDQPREVQAPWMSEDGLVASWGQLLDPEPLP